METRKNMLYRIVTSGAALATIGLLVFLYVGRGAGQGKAPVNRMQGKTFVFNQDGRDVCYMAKPGQAQEWVRDWYRRVFAAGTGVFVADVAQPDLVVTKDTPTGEIVGARFGPGQEGKIERRYRIIAELMAQGTDILHLACEEGRKAGAMVLAGMRMSDAHHGGRWQPKSENALFPQFVMDHPEWCNTWEDGTRDATLNLAIPEVQARRLQILRELATHYDIEGVELDWMRHCRHFPEGRQREHLADLTRFVSKVRTVLDEVSQKKGVPRMILGHRVPVTLAESLDIGCDVATWAKKGLADFLAPMDFLQNDPDVRTDEFVKAVKGTPCLIYPSFGSPRYSFGEWYQPRDGGKRRTAATRTFDQFRATAANWYAWGAKGGSSYNMYLWPLEHQAFYTEAIAILSDAQKALAGPRHYVYLPTWKDHLSINQRMKKFGERFREWRPGPDPDAGVAPTGRRNAQSLTFGAETVGRRQIFTFRMADGRNGEKLSGWLRLRIYDATSDDKFSIDLNGKALLAKKLRIQHLPNGELSGRTDQPIRLPEDGTFDWPPNLRFEIDLADCPPFKGDNELGIVLVKKNPAGAGKLVMEALEVMVR